MATELLVAQETSASNDGSPSETSDNDDADGDQNPRTDSVRGSLAHSADKGKAQEDTETGTGRYQYNGDPGAITTEDSGKDQKTKIAAICITVLALLVLAVVGFKVFMCLRKRSEGDSDRESWMEAESVISEKYEVRLPGLWLWLL